MDGELFAKIIQMRESASSIRTSANRIRESVETVDAEIRSLSVDRFTSTAAEEFRSRYIRLTPRLREAADMLLNFQEKLVGSADEIEVASRPTE